MEKTKYYLGLDLGTNSVGWAITDPEYHLLRKKGKDAWGIREFDEAEAAVTRRTARISRRRRQREIARIGLLKCYFHDAITEIDPFFFERLENSKYYLEDKDEEVVSKNGLFDDADFTDKDYYRNYPTVFHLRKALIENEDGVYDVRLVYLALLNMFKHRGHFLNQSLGDEDNGSSISAAYTHLAALVFDDFGWELSAGVEDSLGDILSDRGISRTVKAEKILTLLGINKKDKGDKRVTLIKAFCGLKVDAVKLFENLDSEEKVSFCFSEFGYEDKADELAEKVGEENYSVIEAMKALYDAGSLAGILKGFKYLSFARVADYEKHKNDLAVLKRVYKKISIEKYNDMFRSDIAGSYSAYVGSVNSDEYSGSEEKKLRRDMKGRSRDELYKRIKGDIAKVAGEDADYIRHEMEIEAFLPKQLTAGNGVIPNQVHKIEMRAILSNAEDYLPFLLEQDEHGLTISERILQLFSFQIPYYVGPVSTKSALNGGNGWVVRKEDGPVLPWNLDEKIDDAETRKNFIERLIRECTYIKGEKVLPKGALLYEKFCVLNEINNLRIDGERIPVALKQEIYQDLFEKGKKVTRKQLCKYLFAHGCITDEAQVTGIDIAINNSLGSFGKFYAIFGDDLRKDSVRTMVEDIICLSTIYGDAKTLLKKQIEEKYGDTISAKDLKRILGYKFSDWGRLSKAILELQGMDKESGEVLSLISAMWDTEFNFMELLNSERFTFRQSLEETESDAYKTLWEFTADDLDDFYFSAPVKRMVWQTLQIIKEISSVMGCEPERIFLEMPRTDEEKGDKGRKNSRKSELLALYKSIKDEDRDWASEIEKADENGSLRSKKLFLYYRQMGRCMYTGEPIDLNLLLNDNLYDIDHIYPRHFVKDDNIANNLVLVKKTSNAYKSDTYPIPSVSETAKELWRMLHEKHLINDEKYKRLTSRSPFTEEQQAGFIARQLVETGQATKGIADLLKQLLPETTIVYSKAVNVSDFRRDYGMIKCRSINDLHHAKDAYLNIVVGNVYYVKFTKNPLNFIRSEYAMDKKKYNYNLGRMFERDVKRGDEVAWIAPKENGGGGTIAVVKKVMMRNTPLMTRMNFEAHGGIANATLYSKRKAKPENYFPLKTGDEKMQDVKKYGGYTSASVAYFFLVEHGENGKRIRSIESVPIYQKHMIEATSDGLVEYCRVVLKLVDPDIRLSKIKVQSLLRINNYEAHVTGKTENRLILRNAVNMFFDPVHEVYVKKIEKLLEEGICDKEITKERNLELYRVLRKKHTDTVFSKRQNPVGDTLSNGEMRFYNLDINNQCKVLEETLLLSAIGNNTADLTLIGGSSMSGKMRVGKNIDKLSSVKLIHQSVTGLFQSETDLLTV